MTSLRSAFQEFNRAARNAASGRVQLLRGELAMRRIQPAQASLPGEPLRIAIISGVFCPTPPPGYGGVERSIYFQARDLARRGWDVHLWGEFQDPSTGLYEGITLHEGIDPEGLEIARVNPDVMYQAYPQLQRTRRLQGRKDRVIVNEFNAEPSLPPLDHGVHVRCLNQQFWNLALQQGYPAERLITVPLFQDQETEYRPDVSREDWLLWIGRADPCKALEEAFRFSSLTGVPLRFACRMPQLSGNPYATALWRLMPDSVTYLGEIGPAQKRDLYNRCRAMLYTALPSWKEAFGLIFLDALASGTPVLALDHHPGSTQSAFFPGFPYGLRAATTEELARLYQAHGQELRPDAVAARFEEIYGQDRVERLLDAELRRLVEEARART